jgi:hypothetical protein
MTFACNVGIFKRALRKLCWAAAPNPFHTFFWWALKSPLGNFRRVRVPQPHWQKPHTAMSNLSWAVGVGWLQPPASPLTLAFDPCNTCTGCKQHGDRQQHLFRTTLIGKWACKVLATDKCAHGCQYGQQSCIREAILVFTIAPQQCSTPQIMCTCNT